MSRHVRLYSTLFGSLSSGILAKWPSHLNLLWLTISETLATLHQPSMISFLILSFKLTLQISLISQINTPT